MVVAGVAVNNVLPGRVGDLLRARWVSRGAFSGGRGLATVVLDRGFDILALAVFLLVSLPFVTDAGWVDRIVLGTLLVLAVLVAAIAAARSYTRRRPRGRRVHRRLPRRFVRDTLEGLSDPSLRPARSRAWSGLSLAAWAAWAVAAMFAGRAVGIELTVVEAVFVTAALNLGVAIPSSPGFVGTYQWLGVVGARRLRLLERGRARVRDRHAGGVVRADDARRRSAPRAVVATRVAGRRTADAPSASYGRTIRR